MTLIPDLQRDLVDAAARMNSRRRRVRVWLRVAPAVVVAATLAAALALLLGGGGFDPAPSSREPGRSPQTTPSERSPKPPPRRGPRPIPGSLSKPIRFEFAGVPYSVVGFQAQSASRGGVFCARLTERRGGRGTMVGATCAGERLLRGELDDDPARSVGSGGLPPQVTGFARADVTGIAVLDSEHPSRVVLSEPWSPEPWRGRPIRFFLVLVDAPEDRARDFSFRGKDYPRLEARLTTGERVDVDP